MPESSLQDLTDAVTDLARIVARQGGSLDRLLDDSRAAAARSRSGSDVPLLVELFALHGDAIACATTARSQRERRAFEVLAAGLERLIVGRGATLVVPTPDAPYDALTMEVTEVVATNDRRADRTIESVVEPGLWLSETGRSERPARVVVRRMSS